MDTSDGGWPHFTRVWYVAGLRFEVALLEAGALAAVDVNFVVLSINKLLCRFISCESLV